MEEAKVAGPFALSYEGGEADEHLVDAALLGASLTGVGQFYNAAAHLWFFQDVPKRLRPVIRASVGPPREGSVFYLIYLIMTHGQMVLFPQLLCEMADLAMPAIVKGALNRLTRKRSVMDEALVKVFDDMDRRRHEAGLVAEQNHHAIEHRLLDLIERLADQNRGAARNMARPVGPSVRSLTHFKGTANEYVIDEPTADVLVSQEDKTVGEPQQFIARLWAIDKKANTCKVEIDGQERPYRGKITDPALAVPGNIYTAAFNEDRRVLVTAKPVLRNGEIDTLYISDAKMP
jgi:hypothetical protein